MSKKKLGILNILLCDDHQNLRVLIVLVTLGPASTDIRSLWRLEPRAMPCFATLDCL